MNILHVVAHMGDGAGKAISGLAIMGNRSGEHTHRVLLLDRPVKLNHIKRCCNNGVEILSRSALNEAIALADVVVINWWGGAVMESFLANFPSIPCRMLLWSHKNGYFDPPFPNGFVKTFDGLLATSLYTLENPEWSENATLVYGFGDFSSECPIKTDYQTNRETFTIGYVGMPGYKRLPPDCMDYFAEVIRRIPNVRFVMAGETSDEFRRELAERGFERHFDLLGWVNDIASLLPTFDVFGYLIRPDSSATTENSLIEAMATALPCVVSRQPIGKYLLEDTVSGILVDSPAEYGQAMSMLYANEQLRKCIGEAGRKYAIFNYRVDENLKRFNDACKRAVVTPKYVHSFEGSILNDERRNARRDTSSNRKDR